MKITRLKRGYRINLTDGEFDALSHLVALGKSDVEGDEDNQVVNLTFAGKRAIKTGRFSLRSAMHIDEDRRSNAC